VPGYGIHGATWADLDALIRASLSEIPDPGLTAGNDRSGRPDQHGCP
jgi:hypothetical protein